MRRNEAVDACVRPQWMLDSRGCTDAEEAQPGAWGTKRGGEMLEVPLVSCEWYAGESWRESEEAGVYRCTVASGL